MTFKTVDVACVLVINDAGEILIGRRGAGDELRGLWEFPGGKREESETIFEAGRRELAEELGLEVECDELICVYGFRYRSDKVVILHFVTARASGGAMTPREHEELSWVTPAAMAAMAGEFLPGDVDFVAQIAWLLDRP